jgi:hypothetical protein
MEVQHTEYVKTIFGIPGLFRIECAETWNSVWHEINWRLRFGRRPRNPNAGGDTESGTQLAKLPETKITETHLQETEGPVESAEERKKRRSILLKQQFITTWGARWNLRERHLIGTCGAKDIRDFRAWFEENYPGVKVHPGDWPKTIEREGFVKQARTWSEFFLNGKWGLAVWLLLGVTAIVGGLTKFRIVKTSHACWLLVWLYGGPLFRWKWLFVNSFDKKPCPSVLKWFIYELCQLLVWLVAFGVYCGITVICVELFAAYCGGPQFVISLPVGDWIAVGVSIAAALLLVGLILMFSKQILGEYLSSNKSVDYLGFLGNLVTCGRYRREREQRNAEQGGAPGLLTRRKAFKFGNGISIIPND